MIDLAGIDLDPQAQLDALDRYDCEQSLYLFLRNAWKYIDGSEWRDGWPMEAVAEHLQAVVDGDIRRLIINIPPRCAKSTLTSVAFPAWTWAQAQSSPTSGPGVQFLMASYANQLVLRDSVKCRRLIESPWYQRLWGERFRLTGDQNTKSRFANDRGGERLITSVGAAVTGEGGSIIVVDDPNAANEAFSEANIQTTIDWWDGTMSTRLNDQKTGAYIIIQQRLAENDLTGHILEKEADGWTHLCYDAETEILTREGWVKFPDLEHGVAVMAVNPATLEGTWQTPTKYVDKAYKGPLISYKTLTADLCVTPDHRMVYGDANDVRQGRCDNWRVRAAKDLPKEFYLPQVIEWGGDASAVRYGERNWEPQAFAEFMGWFLAEGCASGKTRTTRVVQKRDGKHVSDISRIFANTPFNFSRYKNNDKMDAWQIKDRFLAKELEKLGKSKTKHAPWQLKNLAPEYLRLFLLAYAKGDGHFAVRNRRKITIGTSSKRMADDLLECAVKAGWSASLNIHHQKGGDVFNGYVRPDCTIYKVYIRASKAKGQDHKRHSKIRAVNTSTVDYDGRVYCVSVAATAVVVRRNGRVSISGNCLPMRYEPERAFMTNIGWEDPRSQPGELLWEERFGEPEVLKLEKALGKFMAAGQLQQRPEPAGGGIIKREWWQLWEESAFPPMDYVIASLDTAFTTKEINDPSAMTVWGVFTTDPVATAHRTLDRDGRPVYVDRAYNEQAPKAMLMYAWTERLEFHDLVARVAKTCKSMKVDKLLVENKASGISVAQELRRLYVNEGFAVQLSDPRSMDKLARLFSVQHIFEEGIIYAPDKQWAEMVITQVGQFPKGKHDDLVDTCSQVLRHLRDIGLLVRGAERIEDIERMKIYPNQNTDVPLYPA